MDLYLVSSLESQKLKISLNNNLGKATLAPPQIPLIYLYIGKFPMDYLKLIGLLNGL